ncbi:hypothetical protein [Polaromonas sp. SM01]|uniref:hypothetical protein n=1 Tax=Polaromonas sp. SM01 TaxID=3085630 RepID=UPI0029816806|nr:hypothetical protein [Polaromonas sp. SM01]
MLTAWSAHIMTTHKISADSSSASPDFVSADAASLASHMHHCASSHRFFPLYSALQSAHGLVSPRIVTVAAIVAISLALLAAA